MPDLDPIAYLQLAGLGLTWLAAVVFWFYRIRVATGTDRDMFLLIGSVGGCIALTLVQFIVLMIRLG
ncbi:MAG: hypothetical protein AAGH88_00660 [Planctomycetota bacterium]